MKLRLIGAVAVMLVGCTPVGNSGGGGYVQPPGSATSGSGGTGTTGGGGKGESTQLPGGGGAVPPGECVPACQSGFECQGGDCVDVTAEQCDPACGEGFECQHGVCITSGIKGAPPQSSGASWTILVYMAADNDLEPFALQDLLEMETVGGNESFRFVIQIDRHAGYTDRAAPGLGVFDSTKRVVMDHNGIQEVADLGEINTASGQSVAEFIAWGANTYPADRVALILWNHGGGVPGFATDETTGGGVISLKDLRDGVASGLAATGLPRLHLLGFDACLMATFEVALIFSPFAEYLLASEELEPGHGWDYRAFAAVRDNPGLPVPDMGAAVINGFAEQAIAEKRDRRITLSLVDLTKLPTLFDAFKSFAGGLEADFQQVGQAVGQAIALSRQASLEFGRSGQNRGVHVDLGVLVDQLAARIGGQTAAAAAALKTAMADVVVAKWNGPETATASGLSIYFPPYPAQYAQSYDNVQEAKEWRSQLRAFYKAGSEITTTPVLSEASGGWEGSTASVQATLTQGVEVVSETTAWLGWSGPEGTFLVVQEQAEQSGATLSTTWDGTMAFVEQGGNDAFCFIAADMDTTAGLLILEVPFSSSVREDLVVWYAVYDLGSGVALGETYYVFGDGGVGELSPWPGETLAPLIIQISSDDAFWVATGAGFDPTQPLSLSLEVPAFDVDESLVVVLSAMDFGGHAATSVASLPAPGGGAAGTGGGTDTGGGTGTSGGTDTGGGTGTDGGETDTGGGTDAGGGTDTSGGHTCGILLDCLGWCAEDDEDCATSCLASADEEAIGLLDAFINCIVEFGCEDDACVQDYCEWELSSCQWDE